MAARVDLGLISDEALVTDRCRALCEEFGFEMKHWPSLDAFLEEKTDSRMLIASLRDFTKKESAAELAQAIRYADQDAFLLSVVPGTVGKEAAQFAKKSGANLILLKEELLTTSKLEFVLLQVIKSSFLPIKATDLIPDVEVPFDVFHLLPQRQKFLKFIFAGDVLDKKKYEKCREAGEIYIQRADAETFSRFVASRPDDSAAGLIKRCRSQYLALYASYSSLVFLLTDQSEHASVGDGKTLLDKCRQLCDGLLGTLGEFGDAWEVINNSSIGELGSAERAPTIAAYAGLFGLQTGIDNVDQIMLAALLADLGLLLLPPEVLKKIRMEQTASFTAEEKKAYESHPSLSIEIVLNRKLSLDEKFRFMLSSTHERADGGGFPRRPEPSKIPLGAQLIQYCRDFDRRTMLRLGRPRPDRDQVRKEMAAEDGETFKKFTPEFWALMGASHE